MLLRLFAEQVVEKWDYLLPAIEAALPPLEGIEGERRAQRLLQAFLKGSMVCWLITDSGGERKAIGVLTTSIITDPGTEERSLFIYSLYAYRFLSVRKWIEVLRPLTKYAKSEGCINILAYSSVKKVVEIMKEVGADVAQRVLRLEVK